jgi:acyl-CoA thioesterase-1
MEIRRDRGAPKVLTVLLALAVLAGGGQAYANPVPVRIAVLGDSLAAGYGLRPGDAFPARLEAALTARGIEADVIDAGVSGDTSAGGLARLAPVIAAQPEVVIVELGSNDGLRGLDPKATYANLDAILTRLSQHRIRVLLAGTLAPPNLGREFGEEFDGIFPRLAKKHGVAFYPFFLDGVAAVLGLNQDDGIHPNAAGVRVIVERIMPYLVPLVEAGNAGR